MPDHRPGDLERLATLPFLASWLLPSFPLAFACALHPGPFYLEIPMNPSTEHCGPEAGLPRAPWTGAQLPRFALGQLLATPGALKLMQDSDVDPMSLLQRHVRCDVGTLSAQDAQANEEALVCGGRLLSSYLLPGGLIWIITEADRSVTTFVTPTEY